MSGRLEVGCLAMFVGMLDGVQTCARLLVGKTGRLVQGPYPADFSANSWTIESEEIRQALAATGLFQPWELTDGRLCGVPASLLVRIDGPDVGLLDGQDVPKAISQDAMA